MGHNVLLVRHLPSSLSSSEKLDFLKYFGATDARVMPSTGRMKHTAFAIFENSQKAEKALKRLHQTEILNSVLSVEFAKQPDLSLPSVGPPENQKSETSATQVSSTTQDNMEVRKSKNEGRLFSTSDLVEYPSNPGLKYKYPEPNADILVNICAALLTVPKLYTQVLHLMNKLNLVPPFHPTNTVPPMLVDLVKRVCNIAPTPESHPVTTVEDDTMDIDDEETSEESEYESDSGDNEKEKSLDMNVPDRVLKSRKRKKTTVRRDKKRQRMKEMMALKNETEKPSSERLESAKTVLDKRNIDIKVPSHIISDESSVAATTEQQNASQEVEPIGTGFGKILPKMDAKDTENEDTAPRDTVLKDYITEKLLERGRLSKSEISQSSLFKNYRPGEPTCRLYIKNLSKKVTEKDLTFIFGRFVDLNNEDHKNMFSIQILTQGRMKGQAFVGLPSAEIAQKALKATNGYQLISKPMVVHFARSKKPS